MREREVTDAQRRRAEEARTQLARDLAATEGQPAPDDVRADKFSGPLGLDDEGGYQPPLTRAERDHLDEVRRRARDESPG